jgi:hypothetical protein
VVYLTKVLKDPARRRKRIWSTIRSRGIFQASSKEESASAKLGKEKTTQMLKERSLGGGRDAGYAFAVVSIVAFYKLLAGIINVALAGLGVAYICFTSKYNNHFVLRQLHFKIIFGNLCKTRIYACL